jgi:hypothetical protein
MLHEMTGSPGFSLFQTTFVNVEISIVSYIGLMKISFVLSHIQETIYDTCTFSMTHLKHCLFIVSPSSLLFLY